MGNKVRVEWQSVYKRLAENVTINHLDDKNDINIYNVDWNIRKITQQQITDTDIVKIKC